MSSVFLDKEPQVHITPTTTATEDPNKARMRRNWVRARESGYPNLPEKLFPYQVDVLCAALDTNRRNHIFVGLPTAWGKSIALLGVVPFLPRGSITLVIPSLTTLQSQLEEDCRKFGFTVVNLNKVSEDKMQDALTHRPQVVLANVDILATDLIQELVTSTKFNVRGHQAIVVVDEVQVVDPLVGWTEFRSGYLTPTWDFLTAALLPKYIMASATMSESSLVRVSENMGIQREEILTFFRPPIKENIFQELKCIRKLNFRRFFRDCGFILLLIATGRRIQIFVRSREILHIFEQKIKMCIEESGITSCSEEEVEKLVGNNSTDQKENIMAEFQDRIKVLFSTEVAAMGCHTAGLNMAISLGLPTALWKVVQQCGRVGREEGTQAVYITVKESNPGGRVRSIEKEENAAVKKIFTLERCTREAMSDSFKILNPTEDYSHMETPAGAVMERQDCKSCRCCTFCFNNCSNCRIEVDVLPSIVERIGSIMDINSGDADFRAMERYLEEKIKEETFNFPSDGEEDDDEPEKSESSDDSDGAEGLCVALQARTFMSDSGSSSD